MDLVLTPQAEEDLDEIDEADDVERVAKKIDGVESKIEKGISPEMATEKRLGKGWHPMLQSRTGRYRLWFVKGEDTEKGEEGNLYLCRVLEKEDQLKLKGLDINPDTYL